MARRNTPNRTRGRSTSASRSDARKKTHDKRSGEGSSNTFKGASGNSPKKSSKEKSLGSQKSGASRKFSNPKPERAFDKEKRPYGKRKSFSSEGERPSRKFDPAESKDKRPYKKFEDKNAGSRERSVTRKKEFKSSGPSTGLRRERPYKKSFDESVPPPRKNYDGTSKPKFDAGKNSGSFKKAGSDRGKRVDIQAPVQTDKIRLNKFISNSGVCSRREADELITMGLISVNGKTITELGYKVNPGDEVRHENKILKAERPVYILLNKPKGFLTTTKDPQERNTVMHLIANAVKERVYPVGRLDRNTTGLLLLTNDGDLADKLMHPSHNAKKIYRVELDRPLTKADAQHILDGVQLEEGKAMVDDLAIISDDKRTVGIEIHIGWNRVVRRIFEALNYEVVKLDRSVYAGLDKKDLGRGEWRFLTREELVRLKHYK